MYATGECERFDVLSRQDVKKKLERTDIHYDFAISHSEITSACDMAEGRKVPKWAWFGDNHNP
jgi:hypothetical protein